MDVGLSAFFAEDDQRLQRVVQVTRGHGQGGHATGGECAHSLEITDPCFVQTKRSKRQDGRRIRQSDASSASDGEQRGEREGAREGLHGKPPEEDARSTRVRATRRRKERRAWIDNGV